MRPLGQVKVRHKVAGHGNCAICIPTTRRELRRNPGLPEASMAKLGRARERNALPEDDLPDERERRAGCASCSADAVWWYPCHDDWAACDACVPRGCSCNPYPEQPEPCADWTHSPDGFDAP